MHQQIYVNLPCKDLPRSIAFFGALGYSFNPQFSSPHGSCMVLGDNIFAMLLTEDFARGFTKKPIADATQTTEVLVCLSCSSRAEVDGLVAKAVAAGGRAPNPVQDHGFMYGHGFEDLDGHQWELVFMDANAAPPQG